MEADASILDMPSDCCYFVEKAAAAGAATAFQYFDSIFHHFAVVTQNLGQTRMPQSVFNRYEKKYLMPERVYQELRGRLSPYMQVDSYGLHTIVHFDDVAVYRHLAKIRSHVLSTELRHLRLNHSFLVI